MTLDGLPFAREVPSISAAQMAEVDRITIEEIRISVEALMENASHQIATVARALAGTLVMFLVTLAGRGVRAAELGVVVGEFIDLTTMKATTMTITASTLPPVMNMRLRWSARRSAARCAAIFSRAFCCLILVALLIVNPQR